VKLVFQKHPLNLQGQFQTPAPFSSCCRSNKQAKGRNKFSVRYHTDLTVSLHSQFVSHCLPKFMAMGICLLIVSLGGEYNAWFLKTKPTICTNFSNLFLEWNSTCFGQFLCPSSRVFHSTHSNGICYTGLLTACKQVQDGQQRRIHVKGVSGTITRILLRVPKAEGQDRGTCLHGILRVSTELQTGIIWHYFMFWLQ
jgi:hypothetical protein